MQRTERAGAGSINDAVCPAEVELLADSTCDYVSEESGKRVLLPRNVAFGDPLHHILCHNIIYTGIFEGVAPDRVAEPCP